MVDADKNLPTPLIVDIFQQNEFDMTSIVASCQYQRIEIVRIQSLRKLVHTNVRVLKHAIVQMANHEKALTHKCNTLILRVFATMDLPIKVVCVKYFVKWLVSDFEIDENQQEIMCCILDGAMQVMSMADVWLNHRIVTDDDLKAFIDVVCELVACPRIPSFSDRVLAQTARMCIQLLQQKHCATTANVFNRLTQAVFKCVVNILDHLKNVDVEEDLYHFLLSAAGNEFLANVDVHLMGRSISFGKTANQSSLWTVIAGRMAELCAEQPRTIEDLYRCLCTVKMVLDTAKSIEHRHVSAQQVKLVRDKRDGHISNEDITRCSTALRDIQLRLFPNIDAAAGCILQQLTKIVTHDAGRNSAAYLKLATEVAVDLLTISDGQDIDAYVQLQLLLIALSPLMSLSELLKNHVLQEFAQIVAAARNSPALIESTMAMLCQFNLEHLSSGNRDLLMDFLQQIVGNATGTMHHRSLTKILINFLIQEAFRIDQFENFLKIALNNADNHQLITDDLKSYLCLAAGNCNAYQFYRNGECRITVQCTICDGDNGQHTNVSLADELEQLNGKLLLTPGSLRRSQFTHSFNYFHLFQSSDTAVRMRIVKCIPALLHHMTPVALQLDNVRLWLDPMMDVDSVIRYQMAKNLKIIPEIVKV